MSKVKAVFSDKVSLFGVSAESKRLIKEDLTFNNPAYANAKKFSRYAYTTVPPFLTYYEEGSGYISVPVGYDISKFDVAEVVDERVQVKVNVPQFVLTLREDQEKAVESYLKLNQTSKLYGGIQMPTGKGKSILGLYLAYVLSVKTLIVVHKNDLITGWQKDIKLAFNGKVKPGLIKAQSKKVGEFITLATVQTLSRMSPEELSNLHSQFGLVIQDEMHHCPATTFGVVSEFKSRYKLGLTATPERTDGLDHVMNLYYGEFCYRHKHSSDDEDILPVQVIVRRNNLFFDPLCVETKVKGKYTIKDLTYPESKPLPKNGVRLSEIPYRSRPRLSFHTVDDIVVRGLVEFVCEDILEEYGKGRSCVVFFTQKDHCRLYYEYLKERVPEEDLGLYYGDNANNEEVLERAESVRKFITLTTYAKATEGTNVRQWEVEFLVSSINNGKNVEQAVGRIRRTKENKKINPVIVYDYRTPRVYSMSSHGRTRDTRYRDLKFRTDSKKINGLFSRGFR